MNPALSPQTTGLLPSEPSRACTSSRTAGSVTTVRTTSTSRWTGAGLKKWMPTTRPGAEGRDDGVEVAEDGDLHVHGLDDGLDHEVGVGEVLQGRGEGDPAQERVGLVLGQLLARNGAAGGGLEVATAAGHALVVLLHTDHGVAVTGEDLGDAGTHGAEAHDTDGGEGAGGVRSLGSGHGRHHGTVRAPLPRGCSLVGNLAAAQTRDDRSKGRLSTSRAPHRSSPRSCS